VPSGTFQMSLNTWLPQLTLPQASYGMITGML
jgi:hypothetical protein